MRKVLVFGFLLTIPYAFSSCVDELGRVAEPQTVLSNYLKKGIYKGLTPSDESPVGMGEIQLVITPVNEIKVTIATGLENRSFDFNLQDYVPMSEDELKKNFVENPTVLNEVVGFKHKDDKGPAFIFSKKRAVLSAKVLMRVGMGDMLGPTMLFSPTQRKFGLHWLNLQSIEFFNRGSKSDGDDVLVPRIKYNGTNKKK